MEINNNTFIENFLLFTRINKLWGEKAFTAGGQINGSITNTIEYFNISCKSNATAGITLSAANPKYLSPGSNGHDGVFTLSYNGATFINSIDYFNCAIISNAVNFGGVQAYASGTQGAVNSYDNVFFFGGNLVSGYSNYILQLNILMGNNSTDVADLSGGTRSSTTANGESNIALIVGGYDDNNSTKIDRFNCLSIGNTSLWPALSTATRCMCSCGNLINIIIMGGYTSTDITTISYLNYFLMSTINSFGSLTEASDSGERGTNNNNTGLRTGGYITANNFQTTIDYFNMSTTGNAIDFGDLNTGRHWNATLSGN